MGTEHSALMGDFEPWYFLTFGQRCSVDVGPLQVVPGSSFFRSQPYPALTSDAMAQPRFLEDVGGYAAAGLCATGPQTTYFVLTLVDATRRHYFRLPFCGPYTNGTTAKREIADFLEGYQRWQSDMASTYARSSIIYSTGYVDVRMLRADNSVTLALDGLPQRDGTPLPSPASLWTTLRNQAG